MKNIILFLTFIAFFASASVAYAADNECPTGAYGQYGQGTVCGVTNPPIKHEPKDINAGLEDINPMVLGSTLIAFSGVLYLASNKAQLQKLVR